MRSPSRDEEKQGGTRVLMNIGGRDVKVSTSHENVVRKERRQCDLPIASNKQHQQHGRNKTCNEDMHVKQRRNERSDVDANTLENNATRRHLKKKQHFAKDRILG